MEIFHVKNQHSRITSSEVWQGAIQKGGLVIDSALSVIPMFKQLPKGWLSKLETYNTIKGIIPTEWMSNIYQNESLNVFFQKEPSSKVPLTIDPSSVLMAHRAMQFNADRMALIATGSLAHTIESFFIGRKDLLPFKNELLSKGLSAFSKAQVPELMQPTQENITLRAASLIAFYLSKDYQHIATKVEN